MSHSSGAARRTLGICLLLIVVVLWTASNFLASDIFADDTYSKPFFVTYVNTAVFIFPLFTIILGRLWKSWRLHGLSQMTSWRSLLAQLDDAHDPIREDGEEAMLHASSFDDGYRGDAHDEPASIIHDKQAGQSKLGLKATARLSFEFCMLWFLANYFAMACLQFTTVGSTTILTSTSGVWTLIFGAFLGVEKFTIRKCLGVVASLFGIILISRVDMSSSDSPSADDGGRGSFPHKTPAELILGDAMAAFSAIMYGIYTIVMKKQVGDESRVNMQLFFGLVGLFNLVLLWPGFVILHLTGIERFSLPDSGRIWIIILINAAASLFSDICWAYAMLLTTPLVVTVGLSLTIPLSLVGQIFIQSEYATPLYWFGAAIVFLSFMVVNHESHTDEDDASRLRDGYEVIGDGAVAGDDTHRD
ncbi:hypothetical protein ASPZODRAFT_126931 [Penicilliopsis zonata CBS 506.65]|uniref:Uncharacterized protein n=1 Tax=Penicilliopsis zonata CBS 506.65 TaxID=1073090 RepID=A0A1L9SUQ3_9EURO|nr:hypothetical protein ASPZODRAFT_126931 [Penicilliopsis zonata CBS 506.65]OJJ50955.1 hypothetical protein ASPZODRAFT_126931 [Penicilliopsis zonata CBS 506.65]